MILATLTWVMLDSSHWRFIEHKLDDNRDYKLLWDVNKGLEEENKQLREKVMMLEQTTDIDRQTAGILQDELKGLQDEIHLLKGELEFYQEILDSAATASGLDVQGIHVQPLVQPDNYRLKLILTHVGKTGRVVEGVIDVMVEGIQNKNNRLINLADVSLDKEVKFDYNFRNFQRFECNFKLPEDFRPQRVLVNLLQKNSKQPRLKKVFDWPDN